MTRIGRFTASAAAAAVIAGYAQPFAALGATTLVKGDISRDDRVSVADIVLLKNYLLGRYGLNEKQAAELQALNEKQMPRGNGQRRQRPEGGQAPRPEGQQGQRHGGNRQEMMKQYNEELQKIMTADQFKAYTEDMEKRRQERQNRQGRP